MGAYSEPVNTIVETRSVPLPKGETLLLDITESFYPTLRKKFNLSEEEHVSDEHIRMFVFGTLKSAIDKAENEQRDP